MALLWHHGICRALIATARPVVTATSAAVLRPNKKGDGRIN
jgi:hypothetical protein